MKLPMVVLGAVLLALCVFTIICIGMQQSKSKGLGAITGGADTDTFFGKNKGRSRESRLSKITIVLSILFVLCVLALDVYAAIAK